MQSELAGAYGIATRRADPTENHPGSGLVSSPTRPKRLHRPSPKPSFPPNYAPSLPSGDLDILTLRSELWTLDFGLLTLDCGLRTVDCGHNKPPTPLETRQETRSRQATPTPARTESR